MFQAGVAGAGHSTTPAWNMIGTTCTGRCLDVNLPAASGVTYRAQFPAVDIDGMRYVLVATPRVTRTCARLPVIAPCFSGLWVEDC